MSDLSILPEPVFDGESTTQGRQDSGWRLLRTEGRRSDHKRLWAKGNITRTRARSVENGLPSACTAGSTATTTYAVYDTRNLLKRRLLFANELQQQRPDVAGEVAQ
jgi:hypothetical protein